MRTATIPLLLLLPFLLLLLTACDDRPSPAVDAWQPIFDGKTLAGWSAPDLSYFRVEDGAITGETTVEHNPPRNQFIVWKGGTPADFEVKFQFRIFGAKSNSGMQIRSTVDDLGLVHGYQADMDGAGKFVGGIWDEYGTRKSLAARGEHVVIAADGKRTTTLLPGGKELPAGTALNQWTEYHITAVGPLITLRINGAVVAELEDHEIGKAASVGVLAMPIIPGEPMKVQYRDIRLLRR